MDKESVVQLHNGVLQSGKNNDILKFACKWMELEKNILSEVTQTQKDEHGMYFFPFSIEIMKEIFSL